MRSISLSSNDYMPPREPSERIIAGAVEEKKNKMATDDPTKRTRRVSRGDSFTKSDNLSKRLRSVDALPCLPRRTPEKSATTRTTTKRRILTRDISKLSKSPQLSRLRRQMDIFG
jgi:hypothetical protein